MFFFFLHSADTPAWGLLDRLNALIENEDEEGASEGDASRDESERDEAEAGPENKDEHVAERLPQLDNSGQRFQRAVCRRDNGP